MQNFYKLSVMNFYITGLNGTIRDGLGLRLYQAGLLNDYIELTGPFNQLRFSDKVRVISEKIHGYPIEEPLSIIAVSFGGYLVLNALQELNLENIKLLLISPVLGIFNYEGGGRIPPGLNCWMESFTRPNGRSNGSTLNMSFHSIG